MKNLFISSKEAPQKKTVKRNSKNPYKNSIILDKLYTFLDRKNDLPSWASPAIHASGLGYLCPRQEVFKRISYIKPTKRINPHTRIIYDIGHAVHAWWQDKYFGPMGLLYGNWECSSCGTTLCGFMPVGPCEKCNWPKKPTEPSQEMKFCKDFCRWPEGYENPARACYACNQWGSWHYKELHFAIQLDKTGLQDRRLTGYADGILYIDDVKYVLDIKTISASRIKKLDTPFRPHILQVMAYMKAFNINKALLVYVPKDDNNKQTMKEFVINFDAAIWHKTEIVLQNIIKALNAGQLPIEGPCETTADGDKKECPYVNDCFKQSPTFDQETLDLYFSLVEKGTITNE